MSDSVFTKIIKCEIPCHKIYEDDFTIAFLDINPMQPGHILVVPKLQVDEFQDLPEKEYIAVWNTVKKIAEKQKDVIGCKRIGIQVIGLDVPHAHVHLLPFNTLAEFKGEVAMKSIFNDLELAEIAKKLAF